MGCRNHYSDEPLGWIIREMWFDFRQGVWFLVFSKTSKLDMGLTQFPIKWVPEALLPGLKRLEHKADH
jgi:hypothetical protein